MCVWWWWRWWGAGCPRPFRGSAPRAEPCATPLGGPHCAARNLREGPQDEPPLGRIAAKAQGTSGCPHWFGSADVLQRETPDDAGPSSRDLRAELPPPVSRCGHPPCTPPPPPVPLPCCSGTVLAQICCGCSGMTCCGTESGPTPRIPACSSAEGMTFTCAAGS